MKYSDFVILADVAANGAALIEQIKALPRPEKVCGVQTPADLNKITLGEYLALRSMKPENALTEAAVILLGVSAADISAEDSAAVLGFANFVAKELERISALFDKTKVPPTEDERAAGVEKLDFGPFGVVDWFALRMGITHDEADATPWVRVYKCLDIDAQKQRYERRLRDVINRKNKIK